MIFVSTIWLLIKEIAPFLLLGFLICGVLSIFLTVETIMLDISEYLRFEVEMLPDELLINEFNKEVDCLRDETELISKRIDKFNNFLSKNSKDI